MGKTHFTEGLEFIRKIASVVPVNIMVLMDVLSHGVCTEFNKYIHLWMLHRCAETHYSGHGNHDIMKVLVRGRRIVESCKSCMLLLLDL